MVHCFLCVALGFQVWLLSTDQSGHYDVIHVLLFGCGFYLDHFLRQHSEVKRPEDPTHFGEQSLQDISVYISMCTAGVMVSKFASSMLTGNFAFFIVPVAFPFIGLAPTIKDVGHSIWNCRSLQWALQCQFSQSIGKACYGFARKLRVRIRSDRFWIYASDGNKQRRTMPQGRQRHFVRVNVCDFVELPPNISGWCRTKPTLEYAERHSQLAWPKSRGLDWPFHTPAVWCEEAMDHGGQRQPTRKGQLCGLEEMPSFTRAWSTNRYGHFECTTRTTTRVLRSKEWPKQQGDASAYRPWHSVLGGEDEMHMASWNNAGSCHHWPVELLIAQLWAAHAQYMEARARCIEVFDNAEPESSSDDDSTGAKPPPP